MLVLWLQTLDLFCVTWTNCSQPILGHAVVSDLVTFNSLLTKQSSWPSTLQMMNDLKTCGLQADVATWNVEHGSSNGGEETSYGNSQHLFFQPFFLHVQRCCAVLYVVNSITSFNIFYILLYIVSIFWELYGIISK